MSVKVVLGIWRLVIVLVGVRGERVLGLGSVTNIFVFIMCLYSICKSTFASVNLSLFI